MSDFALVLTGLKVAAEDFDAVGAALTRHLQAGSRPRFGLLSANRAGQWLFEAPQSALPALLGSIRESLGGRRLDLNIVADGTQRRKRLLIADMDSTIIEQECIDEIAEFAGCGAEVAAITEQAMRGELDFEAALNKRVGLLKGLGTDVLDRVAADRLTITPGARELVATMNANGARTALVSGGFTFFTSRIAEAVGFQVNRANTLEVADGRLCGRVVPPVLGRQAKLDALNELAGRNGIELAATLAVGDGANDLAMIEASGLGVAFRAKPIVAEQANAQINYSDLTALLYLQGYHDDEIIRQANSAF